MRYTLPIDTLITIMLGWIRGFTDWIWNIINLGDGSAGHAFLGWFSSNWKETVLFLLLIGLCIDWIVWMIRWRPYWLWFGKKRRILDDTHDTPEQRENKRHTAPHFSSTVMRRPEQPEVHPAEIDDDEEDALFDVVSPAFTQEEKPVQQAYVSKGVQQYLQKENEQIPSQKDKKERDTLNWFD